MIRYYIVFCFILQVGAVLAEDFEFDISKYEKKSYEIGGYLELKPEHLRFNSDSALYDLNFPPVGSQPDTDERYTATLELEGLYRSGQSSINFLGHASAQDDFTGSEQDAAFFELYYRYSPGKLTLDLGKRALKWGTGYAWSPVGFIERRKDPGDPELSREGFTLAAMDGVRSFNGPLQTLAATAVLLPVTGDINDDFAAKETVNLAGKLYALYYDTDIDLLFLAEGSRAGRVGLDFSRNLSTNFEIHGEIAWVHNQPRQILTTQDQLVMGMDDVTSYLLGLRYLTTQDTTYILEYYHNGAGYSETEIERFYKLADTASLTSDPAVQALFNTAKAAGYSSPNPMRNYLYLRVSQKEPVDILYLNAGLTSILNLDDNSYSLIPELLYTGQENTEWRLRLSFAAGQRKTEFGEKLIEQRAELRFRYYF